jgi:hypothetical protein
VIPDPFLLILKVKDLAREIMQTWGVAVFNIGPWEAQTHSCSADMRLGSPRPIVDVHARGMYSLNTLVLDGLSWSFFF